MLTTTATCQVNHIPAFVQKIADFKKKADVVAIVSAYAALLIYTLGLTLYSNDPFVMSAWGKANGIKDEILMVSSSSYRLRTTLLIKP